MPVYQYRREDGSTFDLRQKFTDDPLTIDPATGQRVVRVVQAAGVIFKGSGFYINDSKNASKSSTTSVSKKDDAGTASDSSSASESKTAGDGAKAESTPKADAPAAAPSDAKPAVKATPSAAAAD
jgi:putative FmdB family regulatory protein